MGRRRNRGPSKQDKGKAKVEEPINEITEENKQNESKVEDDQTEKKVPCPVPSVLPRKAHCFSRTLNSNDVIPTSPELYIEAYEGLFLTDTPDTKIFLVFDEDGRSYNMLFSHYVTWEFIRYSISADWQRFVSVHNLKAGDEILFYRFVDRNVCDGYYYILKYVRKSSDGDDAGQQVEDKRKKTVPGPGSRSMPIEARCLPKTLTPYEVVQEKAKLYFDPHEAIVLTDCPDIVQYPPGTYSKDLIVFDADDRQYMMTLSISSHHISGGPETGYHLNTGWSTFLRTHGLKEGDHLVFYRFFDKSVYEQDYYYVLKSEPKVDKNAQGPIVEMTSDLRDVRLEADIAETRRKLEYWKAKKEETIALLELCSLMEAAAIAAEGDINDSDTETGDDDVSGAP